MRSTTVELALSRNMSRVLSGVLSAKRPNPLFGLEPDKAESLLRGLTDRLMYNAGLSLMTLNQYRWFVRELGRIMRTDSGPELAVHLELALSKWQRLGLESNTLQLLVCTIFEKLNQMTSDDCRATSEDDAKQDKRTESGTEARPGPG